ncbi:MAG TPA: hypothetical protein VEB22_15500 [Phycisphaerales bacterium]|nr:hypothetical protein [Phycisphaerales bacterium]
MTPVQDTGQLLGDLGEAGAGGVCVACLVQVGLAPELAVVIGVALPILLRTAQHWYQTREAVRRGVRPPPHEAPTAPPKP